MDGWDQNYYRYFFFRILKIYSHEFSTSFLSVMVIFTWTAFAHFVGVHSDSVGWAILENQQSDILFTPSCKRASSDFERYPRIICSHVCRVFPEELHGMGPCLSRQSGVYHASKVDHQLPELHLH